VSINKIEFILKIYLKNGPPKPSLGVHFRGKVGKKSGTETETELSKKAEKAENGKRKTEFRSTLLPTGD
jgi:hypothetical protein